MICLAQRAQGVQITGKNFVRFDIEEPDKMKEAKFYFLHENATSSNTTLTSVVGQGTYEIKTVESKQVLKKDQVYFSINK